MELEETLLEEVFGILRTTGSAHDQGEDVASMASVEFQEGTIIPRSGLGGEIFVADRHVDCVAVLDWLVHRACGMRMVVPPKEAKNDLPVNGSRPIPARPNPSREPT